MSVDRLQPGSSTISFLRTDAGLTNWGTLAPESQTIPLENLSAKRTPLTMNIPQQWKDRSRVMDSESTNLNTGEMPPRASILNSVPRGELEMKENYRTSGCRENGLVNVASKKIKENFGEIQPMNIIIIIFVLLAVVYVIYYVYCGDKTDQQTTEQPVVYPAPPETPEKQDGGDIDFVF
jgi:hypothetical protein